MAASRRAGPGVANAPGDKAELALGVAGCNPAPCRDLKAPRWRGVRGQQVPSPTPGTGGWMPEGARSRWQDPQLGLQSLGWPGSAPPPQPLKPQPSCWQPGHRAGARRDLQPGTNPGGGEAPVAGGLRLLRPDLLQGVRAQGREMSLSGVLCPSKGLRRWCPGTRGHSSFSRHRHSASAPVSSPGELPEQHQFLLLSSASSRQPWG